MTNDRVEEARGPWPEHRLRLRVPAGWKRSELPKMTPDFSQDDAFQPLLVCVAPYAPVLVTVAIRPAFPAGALEEHAARLCAGEGYRVEVSPTIVASRVGVACDGTQDSDLGPVRLRLCFFEDAGTLWQIGTMAPEPLWTGVETVLTAAICSAELRGSVAALALADGPRALDPDEPVNARLRDQGVGLVPNVLRVDRAAKTAAVGAGAIEASFTVPFGWHVLDDGRRTLVFDEGNRIQVNLSARKMESRDPDELFEPIFQDLHRQSPGARGRGTETCGLPCMEVEGLVIDGEELRQAYLLCDGSRPGLAIVTRVTAVPRDYERAMNVAEVVLRSLQVAAHA